MASKFQPKIRRARFAVPGYSPEQMITLGNAVVESMKTRFASALDVYDQAAPPLKPSYAKWKAKRYPPAIRNLMRTGRTLRGLRVLSGAPNRAVIGFSDTVAGMRMAFNQRRSRQWGVSPRNQQEMIEALHELDSPVKVVKVA